MAKHNGGNAEEKLDQLGEEASQLADKAAEGADQLADEANAQLSAASAAAGDVASGLQKQARQVVSEAGKKAQELTTDSVEKGKEVVDHVDETIDDAAAAAGGLLRESASTLRDIAPKSGVAGDVARQVAGALDEGGRQLQSGRSQGVLEQTFSWVSRHPVLSALMVLGLLGWLFGGRRR